MVILAPLLPSDPESNLPPCCRTHGKHHCMMAAGQPDGASLATEKCPYFPKASSAGHVSGATIQPATAIAELLVRPAAIPPAEPGYRQSCHHGHQKRGPPFLLVSLMPTANTWGGLNVSDNFILSI